MNMEGIVHESTVEEAEMSSADRMAALQEENRRLRQRVAALEAQLGQRTIDVSSSPPPLKKQNTRESILQGIITRTLKFDDLDDEWKNDVELVCGVFRAYIRSTCFDAHSGVYAANSICDTCPLSYISLQYDLMVNEKVVVAALGSLDGPSLADIPWWLLAGPSPIR